MSTAPQSTTALAARIRQQVQEQNLGDGAFLGTEADLAERYNVSRTVAREAVMQLKSVGLLESRKRKGLIVRRPDPVRLLAQTLPALAQNSDDLQELARLRYVLELGAIELAVVHATEAQINRLDELARAFEAVAVEGKQPRRENELELAFHGLILEMTGSSLVAGMQQVLARFFQELDPQPAEGHAVWQHHAIVAALRDRDADAARTLIRLHFKWLFASTGAEPERSATPEPTP